MKLLFLFGWFLIARVTVVEPTWKPLQVAYLWKSKGLSSGEKDKADIALNAAVRYFSELLNVKVLMNNAEPYCEDKDLVRGTKCTTAMKGSACINCLKNVLKMEGSPGDVNYLFIITSSHVGNCAKGQGVLASARHTKRVPHGGRPVSGVITICEESLKSGPIEHFTTTIKHEMVHAFVFSKDLFSTFAGLESMPVQWETAAGNVQVKYTIITSTKVKAFVIEHFNCTKLKGAALENEGEEGTVGAHWEKSWFGAEFMTGQISGHGVFSNLTIALLEDSGWYKPNHDQRHVHHLTWGYKKGCDFVMKSCLGYIKARDKKGLTADTNEWCSPADWKHEEGDTARNKRNKAVCTSSRKGIATCSIKKDKMCGKSGGTKYWPGFCSDEEYTKNCPRWDVSRLTITSKDGDFDSPKVCYYNVQKDPTINYGAEVFGNDSKCFETANGEEGARAFVSYECSSVTGSAGNQQGMDTTAGAGCYKYRCHRGRLQILPLAENDAGKENHWLTCYAQGNLLRVVRRIGKGAKRKNVAGDIVCPSCTEICGDKLGFTCEQEVKGINTVDFIGDSCSLCSHTVANLVTMTIALVLVVKRAREEE